jgi:hypothetical protein
MLAAMSDDRLIAVIYGLCILLWVASGQVQDRRAQLWAIRGAWALLAIGTIFALWRLAQWSAAG